MQLPGKSDQPYERRISEDFDFQRDYKQDYKYEPNMKKMTRYEQYPEEKERNYRRGGYEEELKPYEKRDQVYDFEDKKHNFYRR